MGVIVDVEPIIVFERRYQRGGIEAFQGADAACHHNLAARRRRTELVIEPCDRFSAGNFVSIGNTRPFTAQHGNVLSSLLVGGSSKLPLSPASLPVQ